MKKQKSEPDWKQFGQFVSMVVTLFTTVRDTLDSMGVGVAEALAWATGPGKKALANEFIRPLGDRILAARPKQVIASVTVNLGKMPSMPFDDASVKDHQGSGIAFLERRPDGLYLDGRRVVLSQSVRQLNGKTIKGHDLRDELSGMPVLNANVLDALYEHHELIPDDWKKDKQGRTRFIYFWGTIYRSGDRRLCVRYLCFWDGGWVRTHDWLGHIFSGQNWAAVLESQSLGLGA